MLYVGALQSNLEGFTQAGFRYLMALWTAGLRDIFLRLPSNGPGTRWHNPNDPGNTWPSWFDPLREVDKERASHHPVVVHGNPEMVLQFAPLAGEGRPRFALTIWEADRVPYWVAKGIDDVYDVLVVASSHAKGAFEASGIKTPVKVVPHAHGPHEWAQRDPWHVEAWRDAFGAAYVFMYTGTWTERKNPQAVLRAYLRAFSEGDPGRVQLVMKLTTPSGRRGMVEQIVSDETGGTRRDDVRIVFETRTEAWIDALYKGGHCFVSAHRGEGWGLGISAAAVNGKHVIATNYSAPAEYLDPAVHQLLPYAMVDVKGGMTGCAYLDPMPGFKPQWADVDADALVAALRRAAADRLDGEAQAPQIRRDYSWEAVGRRFRDVLGV